MANEDKGRGLYQKFHVARLDGSSGPGGKHDGCDYFVLDLTHDPFALAAVIEYARACCAEYPKLAADLYIRAIEALDFDGAIVQGVRRIELLNRARDGLRSIPDSSLRT